MYAISSFTTYLNQGNEGHFLDALETNLDIKQNLVSYLFVSIFLIRNKNKNCFCCCFSQKKAKATLALY